MLERLDFEPGQRTIELCDREPGVLHAVLWRWRSEVGYLMYDIEQGNIPQPSRLFHKSIRHVVLYCDSKGRVNPEPLQRISDQIAARYMKTLCVCGGNGITHCNRCAARLEPYENWASIDEMKRTFAEAMAVTDRVLALARLEIERGDGEKAPEHKKNPIPADKRTRPLKKKDAARHLGQKGNEKRAVEWLNKCIDDGLVRYYQTSRQSGIFHLDDFPEASRQHIRP